MSDDQNFNYFTPKPLTQKEISDLKKEWKAYVSEERSFEGQKIGEDKGIVMTAGGLKYFTCAWVSVSILRELGCNLPVEIWFYGSELTKDMQTQLRKLNVRCCDMSQFVEIQPHGFLMKPLSIMFSNFKEVLFLDADNICVKDPSYLFEDRNYLEHGSLFWPDYWSTSEDNSIWEILDVNYFVGSEQDSGQILIDKSKSWDQLQLCTFFNLNGDQYYKLIYGDKDTFRFAWLALNYKYYMIPYPVASCGFTEGNGNFHGNTMVQFDPDGEIIFLHRNLFKWDITLPGERVWGKIKIFEKNASARRCFLRQSPKNQTAIELAGDTYYLSFDESFPDFEEQCLAALDELRSSPFYRNELFEYYLSSNRQF